jgi:diguanylate cyclase (GGDEF)-like protein/PAS domain S-box-containing protein
MTVGDDAEDDDFGLAAAIAQYPDALITAITYEGQFCPMPEGLPYTQQVLEFANVFEMVPKSEWGRIGSGWLRLLEHGSYVGSLETIWGDRRSTLNFDARKRFGVLIMLVIPDETLGNASDDDTLPMTARFGVYQRNPVANVVGVDEGAQSMLGWSEAEIAEWSANDLIHPDDQANALENWLHTLASPADKPQRWRGRHRHQDGSFQWIEFTNTNRTDDLGYVVSEMMDISDEMATAEALRERDELLARLNDALPLGVVQIDRDWNVRYANNQLFELIGRERSTSLAEVLDDVDDADRPQLVSAVNLVLDAGTDHSFEIRLHLPAGDRVCLVNLRALRDRDEAITGAVLCVSDITEAYSLRAELEVRATFDQLTGCHNRASTMAALEETMTAAGAAGKGTAVIFIDLDRFKPVNDELGHAAGDDLLVEVAERLRRHVRDGDVVGRVGGDEFLVVCAGTAEPGDAMHIARRIATDLTRPALIGDREVCIGASLGVAWTATPDATPDSLVAAADTAMYRSKRVGSSLPVLAGAE